MKIKIVLYLFLVLSSLSVLTCNIKTSSEIVDYSSQYQKYQINTLVGSYRSNSDTLFFRPHYLHERNCMDDFIPIAIFGMKLGEQYRHDVPICNGAEFLTFRLILNNIYSDLTSGDTLYLFSHRCGFQLPVEEIDVPVNDTTNYYDSLFIGRHIAVDERQILVSSKYKKVLLYNDKTQLEQKECTCFHFHEVLEKGVPPQKSLD